MIESSSGMLLYYGGEEWRDWMRWAHIGGGIVAVVAVPLHVWLGRRRSARSVEPIAAAALGSKVKRA